MRVDYRVGINKNSNFEGNYFFVQFVIIPYIVYKSTLYMRISIKLKCYIKMFSKQILFSFYFFEIYKTPEYHTMHK